MDLTLKEVAARLSLPIETVRRWVRQGKIPMQHSRGAYTIRREMLERWAEEHKLKIRPVAKAPSCEDAGVEFDGIHPAMQRGGVFYDIDGENKEQVLQSAVDRIPNLARIDRTVILEKLVERENLASTGIGNGIALPHPRANPGIGLMLPQISTCFLAKPLKYDAIDHKPVTVLMVLLSNDTKLHLSLLSKLAFILRDKDFSEFLRSAPPKDKLLNRIAVMEDNAH